MEDKYYLQEVDFGGPQYDEALKLRHEELRKPLGMEFYPKDISLEWEMRHFCLYDFVHKLLGTLVMVDDEGIGRSKMRQVAIDRVMQGNGIGCVMVQKLERLYRNEGKLEIYMHARKAVWAFYKKLDYKKKGKEFEEVGIPHYYLYKKL